MSTAVLKLAFDKQAMNLAHVNLRSEVHGQDRTGAIDLKFHMVGQAKLLDMVDPSWAAFLFFKDKKKATDLVDDQAEAPHARNNIKFPMTCIRGMVGAKLKVRLPGQKEQVSFREVKVNKIEVTPKDGGIIDLKFRCQVYPNEEQLGKIGLMLQQEVQVTLTAGKEEVADTSEEDTE